MVGGSWGICREAGALPGRRGRRAAAARQRVRRAGAVGVERRVRQPRSCPLAAAGRKAQGGQDCTAPEAGGARRRGGGGSHRQLRDVHVPPVKACTPVSIMLPIDQLRYHKHPRPVFIYMVHEEAIGQCVFHPCSGMVQEAEVIGSAPGCCPAWTLLLNPSSRARLRPATAWGWRRRAAAAGAARAASPRAPAS